MDTFNLTAISSESKTDDPVTITSQEVTSYLIHVEYKGVYNNGIHLNERKKNFDECSVSYVTTKEESS